MRVLALVLLLAAVPLHSTARTPFNLLIQRNLSCNNGEAVGSLSIAGAEVARTLELPWKNNEADISRVPAGKYAATVRDDGSKGWRIELKDVPDRKNVQLHIGNYPAQTEGCVLLGKSVSSSDGTCAVASSAEALASVRTAMAQASDNGVSSQPLDITVEIRD